MTQLNITTYADAVTELAAKFNSMQDAAHLAASALLEAEIIGQPRFGLDMMQEFGSAPKPVATYYDAKAISWRNCGDEFSPVSVAQATLDAIALAKVNGFAVIFLQSVRGFGRLAPFVRAIADAGLVGLAGAQGPKFVAPVDGKAPVIGTNPFAFAAGIGTDRVVIDIATAATTMAALKQARQNNSPLPDGVALNTQGQPTTEASLATALLPRGGRLGSLTGLFIEILAGVIGRARDDEQGRGVFLIAIDPAYENDDHDWKMQLQNLRDDWQQAQGHWPAGKSIPSETILNPTVIKRLEQALKA
ncbi:Ldh family oxidoreductase [Brucellaceae bacterium C25G]